MPPVLPESQRLQVQSSYEPLTHYLFRYPAKFHPPVARRLLELYTIAGQTVLDPFCGSGTLLIEAMVCDRQSVGLDIDPVAVWIAEAKAHRYSLGRLRASAAVLRRRLLTVPRYADDYSEVQFSDLDEDSYYKLASQLSTWIPSIPGLFHWFRRYVIIDLARILRLIHIIDVPEAHRRLFLLIFASIIRNASNADPVPVSGLEVTAHMKRRDAKGRTVDPYQLFDKALSKALSATEDLAANSTSGSSVLVLRGDATDLRQHVSRHVDAVITSPPYHGAVDYYRRHQLEMYWLGLTATHDDRLQLLHRYIGRPTVPKSHPYVSEGVLATALAKEWDAEIRTISEKRANAFKHYLVAMTRFFRGLGRILAQDAPVVLVVGNSSWNDVRIPTAELFAEIAAEDFALSETLWYPVKNRYMSYQRRNGADINTEYVVVLRRR